MESNWMKTKYHIILKTPQEFDNAVTFYVSTFGAQVKENFWHQGHTFCKELGIAGKSVVLSIGNGQSNADPDNNIGRLVLPTSNCELVLATTISVGAQQLDISTVEEELIGVKAKFVDPFGFTWLLTQGEELVDLELGFFEIPGIPRAIQLGRSEQTESWLRMCKTSTLQENMDYSNKYF